MSASLPLTQSRRLLSSPASANLASTGPARLNPGRPRPLGETTPTSTSRRETSSSSISSLLGLRRDRPRRPQVTVVATPDHDQGSARRALSDGTGASSYDPINGTKPPNRSPRARMANVTDALDKSWLSSTGPSPEPGPPTKNNDPLGLGDSSVVRSASVGAVMLPRVRERDVRGPGDRAFPKSAASVASSPEKEEWFVPGPPRALVGLANLGNTCFMNSILQCLSHTVPLSLYFLRGEHGHEMNKESRMRGRLAEEYSQLVDALWDPSRARGHLSSSVISPLKTQLSRHAHQFSGFRQHDSHELLRFLVDGLQEDLGRPKKPCPFSFDDGKEDERTDADNAARMWANYMARNDSVVTQIFCGQLLSTVECKSCHRRSKTFDPFMDLSVPVAKRDGLLRSDSCTLPDCIRKFFQPEILERREQYYCGKCQTDRDAVKRLVINRLPPVLVVHLKRFSRGTWSGSKLNTLVQFPLRSLDMSEWCASGETGQYELYATSNHMGGLDGGHYVAHSLADDGKWYCFNDSRVSEVSEDRVVDASAYVLFYRRVS